MTKTFNVSQSADDQVIKREIFDDFKRLANCSQDAIYHYDIDSRRFLFHNQRFRNFFQLENRSGITAPSDIIVKSIHPEDREQALKALNESLAADHSEGEVEYRVVYPDGSIRWLQDRWIVLRNIEGKPRAIEGFICSASAGIGVFLSL